MTNFKDAETQATVDDSIILASTRYGKWHGYQRCGDNIVNDVIADKNVVTKIMNKSTGLQRIELNGFDKRHWQTCYYPFAYGWCLGLC